MGPRLHYPLACKPAQAPRMPNSPKNPTWLINSYRSALTFSIGARDTPILEPRPMRRPISNGWPNGVGCRQAHGRVGLLVLHLPRWHPVSHGSRNGSGCRRQPAINIRVCAKQTLANGLFNERERLLGLSRFGFGNFGTKLYGHQLIFLSLDKGPGLFQRAARVLQLTFGGGDDFTLCPLGGFRSHFGKLQSFQGACAKRLGTGFGIAGVLLHTAEDIRGLIYQIEGCCSLICC